MATVYTPLLDEGVDVWRPVASKREGGFYRITDSMPADERWAFDSESLVRCEERELSDGRALVAVEAV